METLSAFDLAGSGSHPHLPPPLPYLLLLPPFPNLQLCQLPGSQASVLAPVWKQGLEYALWYLPAFRPQPSPPGSLPGCPAGIMFCSAWSQSWHHNNSVTQGKTGGSPLYPCNFAIYLLSTQYLPNIYWWMSLQKGILGSRGGPESSRSHGLLCKPQAHARNHQRLQGMRVWPEGFSVPQGLVETFAPRKTSLHPICLTGRDGRSVCWA